jgi:hypothetical protein
MTQAARMLKSLSQSVVVISTRLSVAAVLGLAALCLVHQQAVSTVDAATRTQPHVAVEVAPGQAVPLAEDARDGPVLQLAARRSRHRPEAPPTDAKDSPPAHKTSAISPAVDPAEAAAPEGKSRAGEPPDKSGSGPKRSASAAPPEPAKPPATNAPDAKAEAVPPEPPKPETWSEAEIIAGLRECVRLLAPIAADVEVSQPVRREVCGAPAPVLLKRIGSGAAKVEVSPPATLNCAMVASLHAWVEKTLQPAAREALGTSIVRLRNASGYVCRARNGHPLGTDRLSEHALANAIDIAGFVTADGRTIDVVRSWGPTARDKAAAVHARATKAEPARKDTAQAAPDRGRPADKKISAIAHRLSEEGPKPRKREDASAARKTASLQRQDKAISDISADPNPSPPAGGTAEREDAKGRAEAAFLHRLHKGACGVFGTVLGPEANEMHRDHFHFDLAARRHSALCH